MHCCLVWEACLPGSTLHSIREAGSLLWTSRVEDLQERVDSHGRQEAAVLAHHLAAQRPAVPSLVLWPALVLLASFHAAARVSQVLMHPLAMRMRDMGQWSPFRQWKPAKEPGPSCMQRATAAYANRHK